MYMNTNVIIVFFIILLFFLFKPTKPTGIFLHKTCFKVDGKNAKFSAPPQYTVRIGSNTYPFMWKPDYIDTFTINNQGEYKTKIINRDGKDTFWIDTLSGPYTFVNC